MRRLIYIPQSKPVTGRLPCVFSQTASAGCAVAQRRTGSYLAMTASWHLKTVNKTGIHVSPEKMSALGKPDLASSKDSTLRL